MSFFVGLDLGQRQDPTALAAVEQVSVAVGGINRVTFEQPREMQLHVRHLERVRLGTPYLQAADRVSEVLRWPGVAGNCTLVADATGVGAAVLEMLRPAGLGCPVVAVTITGGERATRVDGGWRVPKRELIAALMVSLQTGQLRIARKLREAGALVDELMRMRATISDTGHERFGAKAGSHDDLVLALALAVWRARSNENKSIWGTGDLVWW
jgi:hypothetical protein